MLHSSVKSERKKKNCENKTLIFLWEDRNEGVKLRLEKGREKVLV